MAGKVMGKGAREFAARPWLWQILDGFMGGARQKGCRSIRQDRYSRMYQRGTGILMAPRGLRVAYAGGG